MKKLLKVICVFIAALAISFAPIMINNASADLPKDDTEACASMDHNSEFYKTSCVDKGGDIYGLIQKILNFAFIILGIICVCIIVYSGYILISSAGDPGKVAKAKSAIIGALIGLVIAISAIAITNFIISAIGGDYNI